MSDVDNPYRAPRPGRSGTSDAKAWADTKDAHRLIAEALARLVATDPTIPPHPYLSRHLAHHAARGDVLDDAHVPLAVLPWESSANVRTLLRQSGAASAARRQEWLEAWARIEPFIGGAGPDSRLTSLHLAHHAATRPRAPLDTSAARVSGSRVTPLWSDWTAQDNVLAVSETRLESLTRATTADGRCLLVTGDSHGTIRTWEPHGVPAMAPLHTYGGAVQHLLPLPGDLLLSAGTDGSVRVWHLTRGQLLAEPVHRPGTWVSALTLFAAKDAPEVVLVAHSDGRLAALDPATFRPVDIPLPSLDPAPALLSGVGLGGTEGMALAVAQGRRVRVWDPRQGGGYAHEHEHEGAVRALVDLAAPGRYALCDDSGYVGFRDASTGRETAVAPAPPAGPAIALTALTVAGRAAVASGGSDHTLRVWDARTGAAIGGALEGHTAAPVALTTMPGTPQPLLVSAGADHTLRRWKPGGRGAGAVRAVRRPVTAAALCGPGSSAGAPLIAVADESGTALWDTGTGRSAVLPAGHATVTAFASALVRGEPLLVTAHSDAGVQLWSLDRGAHAAPARLAGLLGHSLPVRSMASFPHDGRTLLVTGGEDGTVRLWDLDRTRAGPPGGPSAQRPGRRRARHGTRSADRLRGHRRDRTALGSGHAATRGAPDPLRAAGRQRRRRRARRRARPCRARRVRRGGRHDPALGSRHRTAGRTAAGHRRRAGGRAGVLPDRGRPPVPRGHGPRRNHPPVGHRHRLAPAADRDRQPARHPRRDRRPAAGRPAPAAPRPPRGRGRRRMRV